VEKLVRAFESYYEAGKAMADMNKITQQTAANAEESPSASEEMNAQAEQMKGCGRFLWLHEKYKKKSGRESVSDFIRLINLRLYGPFLI
jgi:hypothetical protein